MALAWPPGAGERKGCSQGTRLQGAQATEDGVEHPLLRSEARWQALVGREEGKLPYPHESMLIR